MAARAERRLRALERRPGGHQGAVIVIYDAATGQPLQPLPTEPPARALIWLPDNGRDRVQNGAAQDNRAPAESVGKPGR